MKIKLHNVVVFAEEYEKLILWYQEVFGFEIIHQDTCKYHYTELGFKGQNIVGITPAKEMDHFPTTPRNNTSILQLEVTEIQNLFKIVIEKGGKILFGPSKEASHGFYYGGITDLEENQIWIFDENNKAL